MYLLSRTIPDETAIPAHALNMGEAGVIVSGDRSSIGGIVVRFLYDAVYLTETGMTAYPIAGTWHNKNNIMVRKLPKGSKITLGI